MVQKMQTGILTTQKGGVGHSKQFFLEWDHAPKVLIDSWQKLRLSKYVAGGVLSNGSRFHGEERF